MSSNRFHFPLLAKRSGTLHRGTRADSPARRFAPSVRRMPTGARAGVTLVELVVSMAIVAVVLTMAAALFLTSRQSLNRSVRISRDSDAITVYLDGGGTLPEGFTVEPGAGGPLVLEFDGKAMQISGRYETVTSADGQVAYRIFIHD